MLKIRALFGDNLGFHREEVIDVCSKHLQGAISKAYQENPGYEVVKVVKVIKNNMSVDAE